MSKHKTTVDSTVISDHGDQDIIDRATRDGDTMLGPLQRHRCHLHPLRWVITRWTWPVPEDGDHLMSLQSNSWPEIVTECGSCAGEAEAEVLASRW